MSLHRPLYSTSGEETGFSISMRSSESENSARIQRLANGIMRELKRHYREVKFANSEWEDMDARPFTIEVKMLFEVGDPKGTMVCGDRGILSRYS
jgi:hypothetical protein